MPKQTRGSQVPRGGRSSRRQRQCPDASSAPAQPVFPQVVMENSFTPTKEDLQHLDIVCRLCMVRGGPTMENIFQSSSSTSIATQIMWVTQLELRNEDPLPSRICQQCIFRLQLSQNFKQQCISSDKTLRELYLSKEPRVAASVASYRQSTDVCGTEEVEVDVDQVNSGYSLKVEPLSPCCQEDEEEYEDNNSQSAPVNDFKIEIVEHNLAEPGSSSRGKSKAKNTGKGGKAPFVCEDCHRTYPTWDQLRRHRVYHSEKRIPCPEPGCDRKFLRRAQLRRHLLWHSGEKPFGCTECDKKFAAQTTLDVHMRLHTGEKMFKCHLCDKTFGHNSTLTTHVRGHLGDRPYQCPTCPQSFTAKSPLNKHIRTHTGIKPHKCPDCPLTFTLPGSLRTHARTHTGERPYPCPHCDKCFAQPGGLKNHVRIHTGSKPYECKICNKSYRQQGAYSIHMRTHLNIKPYSCDDCSRSFNVKKTLARHMRVHTGEKAFECSICKQAFSRDDSLATHMLIHSHQKPFCCDECNKGFRQKMALSMHMRCHTGERPYKCNYCEMTFAQKGTMVTHMRVHTGEKPFDCFQCGKTFAQLGNLIDHKKRHHPYDGEAKGVETIQEIKIEDEEEHEEKVNKKDLLDVSDVDENVDNESLNKTDDKPMQCQLCSKTFLKLKTLIWHVERFHSCADEMLKKNKNTKKTKSKKGRTVKGRAVRLHNVKENAATTEIITMKTEDKSDIEDDSAAKESNSVSDESTKSIELLTNELTNVKQSSNLTTETVPNRDVSTDIPHSQTEIIDNPAVKAVNAELQGPSADQTITTEHSSADGCGMDVETGYPAKDVEQETVDPHVMDVETTYSAEDICLDSVDLHETLWLLSSNGVQADKDCAEVVKPSATSTPNGNSSENHNRPNSPQCVKNSTSNLELLELTPVNILETRNSPSTNLDILNCEIVENNSSQVDFISDNIKDGAHSITEISDVASDALDQ